uniref:Myelin protein zero like 2 n=1 Tax=Oryzias sinensis TaxID=183150 RepID=A0A8C7WWQ9_9TELE
MGNILANIILVYLNPLNLVLQVTGMRVYTSGDVEAVNGTDVRLRCTFDSQVPINPHTLTISWSFKPLTKGREESVFYYHNKPYPPLEGMFRKRISWAGDVMGRDASIIIKEVKFTYNGTYTCQVKNPPDVHGALGEIRLLVVTTGKQSARPVNIHVKSLTYIISLLLFPYSVVRYICHFVVLSESTS